MPLPEEQELDRKRPMVSPAAVQRNQTGEPQTSRMARFQALKMRFETPTKSEEESQSHGTFKRQRLFRKTSSQSATDCLSKEYRTPGPSRRLNGTASEGD